MRFVIQPAVVTRGDSGSQLGGLSGDQVAAIEPKCWAVIKWFWRQCRGVTAPTGAGTVALSSQPDPATSLDLHRSSRFLLDRSSLLSQLINIFCCCHCCGGTLVSLVVFNDCERVRQTRVSSSCAVVGGKRSADFDTRVRCVPSFPSNLHSVLIFFNSLKKVSDGNYMKTVIHSRVNSM